MFAAMCNLPTSSFDFGRVSSGEWKVSGGVLQYLSKSKTKNSEYPSPSTFAHFSEEKWNYGVVTLVGRHDGPRGAAVCRNHQGGLAVSLGTDVSRISDSNHRSLHEGVIMETIRVERTSRTEGMHTR